MKMNQELRYNTHPGDAKHYDTNQLREHYLVDNIMKTDEVSLVYSFYDRMIVGGAVPVSESLQLNPMDIQKAEFFLQRRELGIFNVGGNGIVKADGETFELNYKDALYIGKGAKEVIFESKDKNNPARFYLNSALAHTVYPNKKVAREESNPVHLGSQENSNTRTLNQYLVEGIVDTCSVMMGYTDVKEGNIWNTMPCHLHPLRMEAYFYFEIPEDQAVCHFMGEPQETRHIWLSNEQAVLSPSWSLHAAAGTTNYCFVWGMSGSNSEMDPIPIKDLR
jgi:4-deoxy-L-threo-5-hexosulose-uronate ketol-isomerase